MARPKKPRIDLNIWENTFVVLTLHAISIADEDEGSSPLFVKGLFIHYDGESVHMNTMDNNPNMISLSIKRDLIDFIEPMDVEEPKGPSSQVN